MKILSDLISVYGHERGVVQSIFVMLCGLQEKNHVELVSVVGCRRKNPYPFLTFYVLSDSSKPIP